MNSHFEFLRRVRIHGGECGAVARALHHEVKSLSLCQADFEKSSGSTNERKSMSTNTVFKRIALTTVAALGFGMLSIIPSKAAFVAGSTTITASAVGRVGLGIDILVHSGNSASATNNALNTSSYVHTKIVGVSNADLRATFLDSTTVTTANAVGGAYITLHRTAPGDTYLAGTYDFLIWADSTSTNETNPDPLASTARVSVTLGGNPASFTWDATSATADSSTVSTTLIKATIKDAAGVATLLDGTANETFTVRTNRTAPGSVIIADTITASGVITVDSTVANQLTAGFIPLGANVSTNHLGHNRLLNSQVQWYVGNNSSTTTTFTIFGLNSLAGVNSSAFTLTMRNNAVPAFICPTTTLAFGNRTDTSSATLGLRTSAYSKTMACASQSNAAVSPVATSLFASTGSGKSVYFPVQTTTDAGGLIGVTVAARTAVPLPTGVTAGSYDYTSDSMFSFIGFTATAPSAGDGYRVTFNMTGGKSYIYDVTYKAPTVSGTSGEGSVVTNIDGSTGKAAVGSTNTVRFTVKDGFGALVSGASVKVQNTRTATGAYSALENLTTDANGNASYTFTDAYTLAGSGATTLNGAGTVRWYVSTANAADALSSTASINYTTASFITPGSITVVGTEVVDADGAAAGQYNLVDTVINETITVKTDTGSVMSGIAYSVAMSSGLYERINYASGLSQASGFTDSSGNAFVRVACFKSGAQTVTFTVGTLTKVVSFTCQSTAGKLRAISVASTSATAAVDKTAEVTVTATDIYGNVVPGASLTVTYTGANGRIVSYNGAQGTTATTNAAGVLVIGVLADKAGTGTLRITTTGGVLATTTTTTQGVAPIARVDDLSVTVTSTGVSSVEAAAEAATDAAAEAIDAANAATDAANLAAEAADAATVAAEEARDAADAATAAVEELATQVATLMAALKAQITTLANTVAKIAKKVKA
jgi:hypothetical protein